MRAPAAYWLMSVRTVAPLVKAAEARLAYRTAVYV